jgi:hypothetical protein
MTLDCMAEKFEPRLFWRQFCYGWFLVRLTGFPLIFLFH